MPLDFDDFKLDHYLDVPPSAQELLEGDTFHVKITSKSLELLNLTTNEFMDRRGIAPKDNAFRISDDPVVKAVIESATERGERMTAQEAKNVANRYYERQRNQCQSDAIILVLTQENKFNFVPQPYTEAELGSYAGRQGDLPEWLQDATFLNIPPPARDLKFRIESRLKQVLDFIVRCGPEWSNVFEETIEDALVQALAVSKAKSIDAESGFRGGGASRDVRPTVVSYDSSTGSGQRDR